MALFKGMMTALWMLFILTVSSAELFNQIPIDNVYQEENDLGAESSVGEQLGDGYWRRNELLYKLMKYLQRDPDMRFYQEEDDMGETKTSWSQLPGLKEPGVKKWLSVFNSSASKIRPQRKWKIKKGKGPLLCYLKLCSFRTFN